MGANFLITAVTLSLQSPPTDSLTSQSPTPQPSDTMASAPTAGLAFERLSDLFQYNRIQGLSLGVGYRLPVPGLGRTAAYATARYGFSDERITGRLTVVTDASGAHLAVSGYHDVVDLDPFSPGLTFANTFNGLLAGHDYSDYALANGGTGTLELPLGPALDLAITARVEDQHSVGQAAHSAINDFLGGSGEFPPNPPIKDGVFGGVEGRLSGARRMRWNLAVDLLGGTGQTTARLYGDIRRSFGGHRAVTIRLKAGAATEPTLPQTLFRVGGVATVRGFEYGTLRSPAFWAAQLDLAPLGDRIRPVLFIDAGQGGRTGDLFSTTALVGGGAGISLFRGLLRLDLSHPISGGSREKVRFDLILMGVR